MNNRIRQQMKAYYMQTDLGFEYMGVLNSKLNPNRQIMVFIRRDDLKRMMDMYKDRLHIWECAIMSDEDREYYEKCKNGLV